MASNIAKVYPELKVCYFLVKHPSQQTKQAQTMVSIFMLFDLERGRIKIICNVFRCEDGDFQVQTHPLSL